MTSLSLFSAEASFSAVLPDEHTTRRLMVDIASVIEAGDMVTLSGDLGAGKTPFARPMIRHIAGDPALDVPSPTFTLMQLYNLPRFPIVHADLYRIANAGGTGEIGVDDFPPGRCG